MIGANESRIVAQRADTCMYEPSAPLCRNCEKPFTPAKPWQTFCTDACRDIWHNDKRRMQIKSPPASAEGAVGEMRQQEQLSAINHTPARPIRQDSKLFSVLAELARGARLTRFDAERVCHDHTLPSTVSEIQRRGILISREGVTVPGHRGHPTRCARYWLTDEEKQKAAVLLGWSTCYRQS